MGLIHYSENRTSQEVGIHYDDSSPTLAEDNLIVNYARHCRLSYLPLGLMCWKSVDQRGSIRLVLNDDGSWRMSWPGPSPRPPRPALPARLPATLLPGFRSPPARLPGSILTGLVTPPAPPPKPRSVLADMLMGETPPPHPRSVLGDILQGLATPPKAPSLSEIAEQILKTAPPKKKTPAEEFAEWLVKQRPPWPPK